MSHQVYKMKPGECCCLLGDPVGGSLRVNVLKVSGTEAVLEPTAKLHANQYVYTTLKFEGGPSLSLSGIVVAPASGGVFIQWAHAKPSDADKVDAAIQKYVRERPDRAKAARSEEETRLVKVADEPVPESITAAPAALPSAAAAAAKPAAKQAAKGRKPAARQSGRQGDTREAKEALVLSGGKLDVAESIRRRAKKVRSADLASKLETVDVLGMSMVKDLIKDAVNEAMVVLKPAFEESERKRLLEETEEAFKERLEVFKAEKADLEQKTRVLQQKLEKAQTLLEAEKREVLSANRFTVSDAGMVELESRLGRMLDHALKGGEVNPALENEMRAVVARLLDDERAKILKQAQEAQSDKISLLEKKIQRLASSLESAEKDRDSARRRAQALEAAGYVPFGNVMEAGLGEDDPDRELKLKLLEEIVKFNQEIRGQLSAVGRLPPPRVRSPEATPASEAKEGAAELGPSDASRQPPAASPAEPSAAEEEARLAAELGIERRTIDGAERKPDGEGPVNDAAAPEGAAGGEPEGPEVDPDDLPWEAPAASAGAKKARNVGIRRLG